MAVVPPTAASGGLQANQWLTSALSAVGGKGGGTTTNAAGKVSGVELELLLRAAESYLQK
jgi:alanyl-tRNA synthetase